MIQKPNAVGLKICERGIVDLHSRNVTLVNCYRKFSASHFPSRFPNSTLCVVLTDGIGFWELSILMNRLETNEELLLKSWKSRFTNPLKEHWYLVPLPSVNIPSAGRYQIMLLGNGELLALSVLDFELGGKEK